MPSLAVREVRSPAFTDLVRVVSPEPQRAEQRAQVAVLLAAASGALDGSGATADDIVPPRATGVLGMVYGVLRTTWRVVYIGCTGG